MAQNFSQNPVSGAWKRPVRSGVKAKKEDAQGCFNCLGTLIIWFASLGLVICLVGLFASRGKQMESSYLKAYLALEEALGTWLFPVSLGLLVAGGLTVIITGRGILGLMRQHDREHIDKGGWDAQLAKKRAVAWKILVAMGVTGILLLLSPLLLFPVAYAGGVDDLMAEVCVSLAILGNGGGVALLVLAALFYTFSYLTARPQGVTREQVVYEELSRVIRELQYHPQGGLDQRIVQQSRLLPFCGSYRNNDLVRGIYRGIPFQQADVSMQGVLDKRTVQFQGRWMVLQIPKRVSGEFFVLYRRFPVINREHIRQSGMQRVELEDTAFHTGFEVWATNPHDVFYVITPALIERLKALVGIDGPAPLLHGIAVCCQGNLLHFAVNGVDDAFQNIFIGAGGEEDTRQRVRRDISLITDLIDTVATDPV